VTRTSLPRRAVQAFRLLNLEQKAAAIAALLLVVSTIGPFSWVELAELVVAGGVLALLLARAERKEFHLPFGDGTVIAAAGVWSGALIVARLFDRPLGQNLLALACAAVLFLAGARERAKHPPDDLVPAPGEAPPDPGTPPRRESAARRRRETETETETDATLHAETEPLPPPEFEPYQPEPGEQLHLAPDSERPEPDPPALGPSSAAARRARRQPRDG
jgi:hypothetical protein